MYDHSKESDPLIITCMVTTECPYKCEYCLDWWNKKKHLTPTFEKLKDLFKAIREVYPNRLLIANITGGEPTSRDDIIDLVDLLINELDYTMPLVTNMYRKKEWWEKVYSTIKEEKRDKLAIVGTIHIGQTNVDELIKSLDFLYNTIHANCYIKMIVNENNYNEANNIIKTLKKYEYIYKNFNLVRDRFSKKSLEEIKELILDSSKFGENPLLIYYDENGIQYKETYDNIIMAKNNRFKGYICTIGYSFLFVTPEGDVRRTAECECECCSWSKKILFNYLNESYIQIKTHISKISKVICLNDECIDECTISSPKYKFISIRKECN